MVVEREEAREDEDDEGGSRRRVVKERLEDGVRRCEGAAKDCIF